MAILKMKKLRLMAVRSRKDELLRELIRHGCVEFSELEDQIQGSDVESILSRESSDVATLKSQLTSLNHAIALLDTYAPKKGKLLSAKPELEDLAFLDDTGLSGALKFAGAIEGYDARIKRISAEESRQRGIIDSLQPWLGLDLPLNTEGTERCGVLMGTIPVKMELADVQAALSQVDEESELFQVNEDKRDRYVLLVAMKETIPAMQECLRSFGFTASALGSMKGTARECLSAAEEALKELASEKEACAQSIVAEAVRRDELKLAADRVSTKIALAEADEKLYGTASTVVMEGWIPEEKEQELIKVFDDFGCAYETLTPTEEEYPEVPVKLKNNKVTNGLNMVTEMYSLPAYGSLDPNPLMAPFFILFYGLMMADMGYGILMVAAALVVIYKMKPKDGMADFAGLLLLCGISTFLMGALTGGFFGDFIPQIAKIINPASTLALPALFTPLNDTLAILIGSLVLGLIQIITGMIISVVRKVQTGDVADAIWSEVT